MIIVLFPSGAFGSTIEYSLRRFTNELTKVSAEITNTGSMHSYDKEFHPVTISEFLKIKDSKFEIVTPVYPGVDQRSPKETILKFKKVIKTDQKVLLIYLANINMAERNCLFAYYKIPVFLDCVLKNKQTAWNASYSSWRDMELYEQREALSFYIDSEVERVEISDLIDKNWMCITPDDLLYNFKNTLLKIIEYFELTIDATQHIEEFYNSWFKKQQYILDEFKTIELIMNNINSNHVISWDKLSIVSEAIIQSRLRKQGIELACYNLNKFPSNTDDLKQFYLPNGNQ